MALLHEGNYGRKVLSVAIKIGTWRWHACLAEGQGAQLIDPDPAQRIRKVREQAINPERVQEKTSLWMLVHILQETFGLKWIGLVQQRGACSRPCPLGRPCHSYLPFRSRQFDDSSVSSG